MSSPDFAAIVHVVTWRLNAAQCPLLLPPSFHSIPHSRGTCVNREAGEAECVQKDWFCPFDTEEKKKGAGGEEVSHKWAGP